MATKTRKASASQTPRSSGDGRYTTRINHVGALIPDTKMMLALWDLSTDVSSNLERMRAENVFAKTSRSRIPEMLQTFRERYLDDPDTLAALVTLAQEGASDAVLLPILFVLATRPDPLLRDTVTEFLASLQARGQSSVRGVELEAWLRAQVEEGRAQRPWSDATIHRLASGLLSTLRDFGILEGKASKRLAPVYLPPPAFAFIAFWLQRTLRSGDKLLHDPLWQLFFLSQAAVEQLFLEAHQERLLEYHAAGRIIRVEFPAASLKEYAHALARRAH